MTKTVPFIIIVGIGYLNANLRKARRKHRQKRTFGVVEDIDAPDKLSESASESGRRKVTPLEERPDTDGVGPFPDLSPWDGLRCVAEDP